VEVRKALRVIATKARSAGPHSSIKTRNFSRYSLLAAWLDQVRIAIQLFGLMLVGEIQSEVA
jgi:hypothetical protein